MKIGVLGAGYVGLATAASFAARGLRVVCADINEKRVEGLRKGEMPFFETGMQEAFAQASPPVIFTIDLTEACACDVVFCCVGTPSAADGSADLSFVRSAAQTCAEASPGVVFVLKSTVPPGASRAISEYVNGALRVAANPEFLREGKVMEDAMNPSRIVIGADDASTLDVLVDLYREVNAPCIATDSLTAEMIKYASNSFLATKISFINELAGLCEVLGADVQTVARGMGMDDRIGAKFLQPGPGYGGSCFPKDVRALMHVGELVGVPLSILSATTNVNTMRQGLPFAKITHALGNVHGKRIAVWGLAFKPETEDIREAPALELLRKCLASGANVCVFDPRVRTLPDEFSAVVHAPSALDALANADALVIMTDWEEFRQYSRADVLNAMSGTCIVDLRFVLRDTSV